MNKTYCLVLSYLSSKPFAVPYTELLNQNFAADGMTAKAVLNKMLSLKLIQGDTRDGGSLSLTESGRLFLAQEQANREEQQRLREDIEKQRSEETARHKAESIRQWVAIGASIFGTLATIALHFWG